MVEYHSRGETLALRFLEHIVFVLVALVAGLIVGIALGLWASRDAKAEDAILYTVGIIQTIPSLALFGILLVPLARLGDLPTSFRWGATGCCWRRSPWWRRWPCGGCMRACRNVARQFALVAVIILALIPLSLLAVLIIAFGFEVVLTVLTTVGAGAAAQLHRAWRPSHFPSSVDADGQALRPRAQAAAFSAASVFCPCWWPRWAH